MTSRAEVARRAWRALAQSARQRPDGPSSPPIRDIGLLLRGLALRRREERLAELYRDPNLPILFIVGAPRSGSTLLLQLITRCFDVGYITNFVSRYWLTPIVGCERQMQSGGLDRSTITLESHYGGTTGPSAPHEFGFFWKTWLGLEDSDRLTSDELERAAWRTVRAECEGIAGWFEAPLVMKNLNACSYQIERLAKEFPQSRFIHASRDADETVASIIRVRRELLGDETKWWSIRPGGYRGLANGTPVEQVRYQVQDVRSAVQQALSNLPATHWRQIELQDVVADPETALSGVQELLGQELRDERIPVTELRQS